MNNPNTPRNDGTTGATAFNLDHDISGGGNDHLEGCIHTPPELGHYPLLTMPDGSLFTNPLLDFLNEPLSEMPDLRAQDRAEVAAILAEVRDRKFDFKPISNPRAWWDSETRTMNFALPAVTSEDGEMPLWMRHYEGFPHSHAQADESDES